MPNHISNRLTIKATPAEEAFQRITGIPFGSTREVMARLRVMHGGPRLLEALLIAKDHLEHIAVVAGCNAAEKIGPFAPVMIPLYAAISEATGGAA